MIDWTKHTVGTARDPERRAQRDAINFLNEATAARVAYDNALLAAIRVYGDLHTPDKPDGVTSQCRVCADRGLIHTEHESLNHQTSSVIAGVYADHFPELVKTEMRHRLSMLNRANDSARNSWGKSGRRSPKFYELARLSRVLPDGRVSYY